VVVIDHANLPFNYLIEESMKTLKLIGMSIMEIVFLMLFGGYIATMGFNAFCVILAGVIYIISIGYNEAYREYLQYGGSYNKEKLFRIFEKRIRP